MVTREDMQLLLHVAEWTAQNRHVMSTIRELAGSEKIYLIIARELDRVNMQVARARRFHAEATLTLAEWLLIVDSYEWRCAYCQEKPFEVMHHSIPLREAGTTSSNCLPSCRGCRARGKKKAEDVSFLC
jgi:hypothetical protein